MSKHQSKSQPTWVDVKAKLVSFDRAGLLGLVQDLYTAHKDTRTFLHTRLGLGEDLLKPYRQTIDRWIWPDVLRNQDTSVAKAKQAISQYRKAIDEPRAWQSCWFSIASGQSDSAATSATTTRAISTP